MTIKKFRAGDLYFGCADGYLKPKLPARIQRRAASAPSAEQAIAEHLCRKALGHLEPGYVYDRFRAQGVLADRAEVWVLGNPAWTGPPGARPNLPSELDAARYRVIAWLLEAPGLGSRAPRCDWRYTVGTILEQSDSQEHVPDLAIGGVLETLTKARARCRPGPGSPYLFPPGVPTAWCAYSQPRSEPR
jgi:hypothetical protein